VSIWTWLKDKFGGGSIPLSGDSLDEFIEDYALAVSDIYIREMAFWSATNLMANAISKCEFKTYLKGDEVKKEEYYLWNIEPNKNQNSSAFLHKLIAQLYRHNECLVIEQNGQLIVADSYSKKEYALYENTFTQVTIKDFTFDKTFKQSEVLFFQLNEVNMRNVVNGLYGSYAKLITYSMNAYQKSKGTKGIFKYDTVPVAGTPEREAFDKLINEKISKWLNSDNAALPLGRGQEWKENEKKTYAGESTRDIKAMIDDVYDFTARSYGIPPVLLKGDLANIGDNVVDVLLTFAVDPLIDTLQEEINRKRTGYSNFSQGTYLEIDSKSIKHIDLLSVSTAIDKLIASGAFCINDIRKLVGEQIIDEPWAWQHWITKNYSSIEELLNSLGGVPKVSNNEEGGE
jgi:HK97 family phage portal protein